MLLIWQDILNRNQKFILTSRVNQDPLENCFSVLRNRGGYNHVSFSKRSNQICKLLDLLNSYVTQKCKNFLFCYEIVMLICKLTCLFIQEEQTGWTLNHFLPNTKIRNNPPQKARNTRIREHSKTLEKFSNPIRAENQITNTLEVIAFMHNFLNAKKILLWTTSSR